jgi:BON domain
MRSGRLQSRSASVWSSARAAVGCRHGKAFAGAIAAFGLCLSGSTPCAEPSAWAPSLSQPSSLVALDLEFAVRARKALLQDEVLVRQMLGVTVRNRVATLWGRASSASVARRAEDCLRNLPGLVAVCSELFIDPCAELQKTPPDQPEAHSQSRMPDTRPLQGLLVHRAGQPGLASGQEFPWRPAGRTGLGMSSSPSTDRSAEVDRPGRVTLPGFPSEDTAPRPVGASTTPSAVTNRETTAVMPTIVLPPADELSRATQSSPPVNAQTHSSLVQATEALRLADQRFWGIRAEVRGDTVYLRGVVYCWEHLFELARAVARLRGVKDVRFDEVQAESP